MRFAALASAAALALMFSADCAAAQSTQRDPRSQRGRSPNEQQEASNGRSSAPRLAPLGRSAAAGPCPYVKVLYDAARYVELADVVENRPITIADVGFTGEIEGLVSDCAYQADDPITVQTRVQFNLGRGPRAQGDGLTYRYWIAVTERNRAVLAKQYFDLPVSFDGGDSASVTQDQTIIIPRAEDTTSGDNFEILVGFDVTPAMAEFNRSGSRFRVNAGTAAAQPPAQ
jgi:hypothetical protein